MIGEIRNQMRLRKNKEKAAELKRHRFFGCIDPQNGMACPGAGTIVTPCGRTRLRCGNQNGMLVSRSMAASCTCRTQPGFVSGQKNTPRSP